METEFINVAVWTLRSCELLLTQQGRNKEFKKKKTEMGRVNCCLDVKFKLKLNNSSVKLIMKSHKYMTHSLLNSCDSLAMFYEVINTKLSFL